MAASKVSKRSSGDVEQAIKSSTGASADPKVSATEHAAINVLDTATSTEIVKGQIAEDSATIVEVTAVRQLLAPQHFAVCYALN